MFKLSLWDADAYLKEDDLIDATEVRIENELNGVKTLSFQYPLLSNLTPSLTFRKIIRYEDLSQFTPSTTVDLASPGPKTVDVFSTNGLAVNDFIIIFDAASPTKSFVAKITNISGLVLTLSRFDFTPAFDAEVRKINWTTYRIGRIQETNEEGRMVVSVRCNHIGYDLVGQYFLRDGRGDISWGIHGSGMVQAENIDIDGLVDAILERHTDSSGDPIDRHKFFKGDLTGIYTGAEYDTDEILVTNSSVIVPGEGGTVWIAGHLNAVMFIQDDPNRYFVTNVNTGDQIIRVNKNVKRSNGSNLKYLLTRDRREISFSDDTMRGALVKLTENWTDNDQIVWFDIAEDKSVNITAKFSLASSHVDSADPISDLVVEYRRFQSINPRSIERIFDPQEFANIVIPKGSASEWRNAETGVHTTAIDNPGGSNSRKRIFLADEESKKFRWGDPVQILRSRSSITVDSATLTTVTVSPSPAWKPNIFAGGLILVTSGAGVGQIRRVNDNSADTITVTRRWHIPPIGATCMVAKEIGEASVRGFGYRKYKVDSITSGGGSGSDYIQINDPFDIADYGNADFAGGMLTVVKGTGDGIVHTILYNEVGAFGGGGGNDVRFYVDGTLTAASIDATSIIEVYGLAQLVEQFAAGFIQARVSDTVFTIKTSAVAQTHWVDDQWNSGTPIGNVRFTAGVGKGQAFNISDTRWDGSNWEITISGTLPAISTTTTAALFIRDSDLDLDIEELPFAPGAGDEVVLLIKETGGTLVPGKHPLYRSTVVYATEDEIITRPGDGVKFAGNQLVFVGARAMTSAVLFGIRRGDQATGIVAEVSSVAIDTLTMTEAATTIPQPGDHIEILALVNATSITTYGSPKERVWQVDTNDPLELGRQAEIFLDGVSTPMPAYNIDFVHLYEVDREIWEFGNYQLGDTIRVIDPEIDFDESTLRVIKESFNADIPADVRIEIASAELRRIQTVTQRILGQQLTISGGQPKIQPVTFGGIKTSAAPSLYNAPVCAFWDTEGKYCRRKHAPNTYCNSVESNNDGALTGMLAKITPVECQGYTRRRLHDLGNTTVYGERYADGAVKFTVVGTGAFVTVDPDSYIGDPEGVDFVVTQAMIHLMEVEDNVDQAYTAEYGNSDVRAKTMVGSGEVLNIHNFTISKTENNNHGFVIEVKAPNTKNYDLYVEWYAWGYND